MRRIFGRSWRSLIWPGAASLMGAVCLLLLALLLFSGGDGRALRAYEEGRRLAVKLADGSIDGLPYVDPDQPVAAEPQMESGLPGNFGSSPEAPLPAPPEVIPDMAAQPASTLPPVSPAVAPAPETIAPPPAEEKPVQKPATYPEAVKQEPESKKQAVAAPAHPVEAKEVHAIAEPTETPPAAPESQAPHPAAPAIVPTPAMPAVSKPMPDPDAAPRTESLPAPGAPLAPAPNKDLTEKTPQGFLPKIGEDGTLPWRHYAKPFEVPMLDKAKPRPIVAIVVSGLGLGRYTTEAAMKLPSAVSFSFSPYSSDVALWAKHARNHGHEALIDLPLQPANYPANDPGPYALMNTLKPAENTQRLRTVLARFPGYVGVLLPSGAVVPQAVLLTALPEIGARGLLLAGPDEDAMRALQTKQKDLATLMLSAAVAVDAELSAPAIARKLSELADLAKKQGYAIGLAKPYPVTIEQIVQWSAALEKQGVTLAPLSAIAKRLQ